MSDYCEDVLWALVEAGEVDVGLGVKTSYGEILADAAKLGALELGRGVVVLSGPVIPLKSWYEIIARKLRSDTGKLLQDDLTPVTNVKYMSEAQFRKTFGKHSGGECDACIASYDVKSEFVFARLYLKGGDAAELMYDVLAHENEDTLTQLRAKFSAPAPVTIAETLTLLSALNLTPFDKSQIEGGSIQLSSIPELIKRQLCAECNSEASQFCSGCNIAKYCDRQCQVANWTKHKQSCKRLKEAKAKFLK